LTVEVTADTHGRHRDLKIKGADIFIHCGDISRYGEVEAFMDFNKWLEELPHTIKLYTAGNHDRRRASLIQKMVSNGIFLNGSGFEWEGKTFWGSPQTPSVWDRKEDFCYIRADEEDGRRIWSKMPKNLDVLITHGPPYGILDFVPKHLDNAGDLFLLDRILEAKPKTHVFGHIHEDGGKMIKQRYGIRFINCSALDGDYSMVNQPRVITI